MRHRERTRQLRDPRERNHAAGQPVNLDERDLSVSYMETIRSLGG
jgi:hypothetical protein